NYSPGRIRTPVNTSPTISTGPLAHGGSLLLQTVERPVGELTCGVAGGRIVRAVAFADMDTQGLFLGHVEVERARVAVLPGTVAPPHPNRPEATDVVDFFHRAVFVRAVHLPLDTVVRHRVDLDRVVGTSRVVTERHRVLTGTALESAHIDEVLDQMRTADRGKFFQLRSGQQSAGLHVAHGDLPGPVRRTATRGRDPETDQ